MVVQDDYGVQAVRARQAAKQRRMQAQAVVKPTAKNSAKKPPKLSWYPMESHDGSVPDKEIDWNSNTDIASEVSERMRQKNLSLLVMPTGFGKTVMSLLAFDRYRQQVGRDIPLIVVAPPKVLSSKSWHRAIQVFNNTFPDRRIDPVMMESYQRLTSMIEHPGTKREVLKAMKPDGVLIVDEFHHYKTPTSKRTKALKKLNMFKILGLTATPLTNDPVMDQISYLVVSGQYNSKTEFYRVSGLDHHLDLWGNPAIYDKRSNRVNETTWPYYRVMVEQFHDIMYAPNVDISDVTMPEVDAQMVFLDESEELDAKWSSLCQQKSKQAFETPVDFMMSVVDMLMTDPSRLDRLVELVTGDDVVQPLVFFQNTSAKEAIAERFDREGIGYQVVDGSSDQAVDTSRRDPVLIQYQAGGAGIEFPDSNVTVFYQNQYSFSQLQQARGRNVRRGRDHTVRQYHVVAQNMFDMMVFDRLSNREEVKESVMADLLAESV